MSQRDRATLISRDNRVNSIGYTTVDNDLRQSSQSAEAADCCKLINSVLPTTGDSRTG